MFRDSALEPLFNLTLDKMKTPANSNNFIQWGILDRPLHTFQRKNGRIHHTLITQCNSFILLARLFDQLHITIESYYLTNVNFFLLSPLFRNALIE